MNERHKAASDNLLKIMEQKLKLFESNKSVKELFEMVCRGIESEQDFHAMVKDGEIVYSKDYTMKGMASIEAIQGMCIELTLRYGPYVKTAKPTSMRSVKIELYGEAFQ